VKRVLIVFGLVFCLVVTSCGSELKILPNKEDIQKQAQQDVLDDLIANGYPIGFMGGTWYMSRAELRSLFPELYYLDTDLLGKVYFQRTSYLYEQTVLTTYVFVEDLLLEIIVTFMNDFTYMWELITNYEKIQGNLSFDYGKMPQYTKNELLSPRTDQDYLVSEKQMGKVVLVHRILIQDGVAGEQIYMFLGQG
jgi:hypothetical protein